MDDEDKKKSMFLGIILGSIFVVAVFFMAFNKFLNKGTIAIYAEPPFNVELVGGMEVPCNENPCKIGSKRGFQNLVISKTNHGTVVKEVKVELWKTVDVEVVFELIPQIETVTKIPSPDPAFNYSILYDEESRLYKLVDNADRQKHAIVFFPKEIKNPRILGSEYAALIMGDEGVYKIDTLNRSKEKITDEMKKATSGFFSDKGNTFAFRVEGEADIFVLTRDNEIQKTSLIADRNLLAWTYDEALLFITDQKLVDSGPIEEVSESGYFIGKYYPGNGGYTRIKSFPEITELPSRIIPTGNGREIFLETANGNFKILLK